MALSIALTGDADLPADLAASYLRRLDTNHPHELDALLAAFESGLSPTGDEQEAITTRVVVDEALWTTAREIISIWMTSRLPRVDAVSPEIVAPEEYFQGRLWTSIRAHPQGLSGGYFGHWHYEPES